MECEVRPYPDGTVFASVLGYCVHAMSGGLAAMYTQAWKHVECLRTCKLKTVLIDIQSPKKYGLT